MKPGNSGGPGRRVVVKHRQSLRSARGGQDSASTGVLQQGAVGNWLRCKGLRYPCGERLVGYHSGEGLTAWTWSTEQPQDGFTSGFALVPLKVIRGGKAMLREQAGKRPCEGPELQDTSPVTMVRDEACLSCLQKAQHWSPCLRSVACWFLYPAWMWCLTALF